LPTVHEIPAHEPINALTPAAYDRLEAVIRAHLGDTFPALALTVIKDGTVRLNAAWGWIDPESSAYPARPDTCFDLASVTKLFTTSAFLSLVSQGHVRLDDPLARVIPEFAESGPRPLDGGQDPHTKIRLPTPEAVRYQTADPGRVTFYHLLTHSSGLAPWRDVFNAAGPAPAPPDQLDPIPRAERWARALRALCAYPFVGQPGDRVVRYSDLGLMLLGEATSRLHETERRTAEYAKGAEGEMKRENPETSAPSEVNLGALDVALRARVFAPLKLDTLAFNPLQHGHPRTAIAPTEDDPGWRGRRCWGEVHDENACGVGGVAGHAGLFGTARDVAAFGQAWLESDPRLNIAPDLLHRAVQEHEETGGMRRGLGWMIKAREDSSAGDLLSADSYGHTGFTGTSLWIDPARALVVACLTNRVYPGREKIGIHAFRRALHDAIVEAESRA
jgi:CubicO group peptidase (beta-lactamase class C family)